MDKPKRSYSLQTVKDLIRQGNIIPPKIEVIQSANAIGFSILETYLSILSLEPKDFYKSVSEYEDHTVWQDVYKKKIGNVPIYIKFKIVETKNKFLLQSFKKDEQE